ncbi:MAG: hypothetical protein DRP95_04265, partial [Candidatus Latescibacterota bacterium]
ALRSLPREGERVFPRQVEGAFRWVREKAGLPDVRIHDLRHTFASRLVDKGVMVEVVRKLLGHSSIVTTVRYIHLMQSHLVQAVQKLEEDTSGAQTTIAEEKLPVRQQERSVSQWTQNPLELASVGVRLPPSALFFRRPGGQPG